jgi:PAS domain S-box-containing protein
MSVPRSKLLRWFGSIRVVMILLIALATIFPLGIIIQQNYHHEKEAFSDGRVLSERIATEVANEQQLLLSSAKQLMSTFSYNPVIRSQNAVAVNRYLAELLRENPQITNLLIVDEKGNAWASGLPMKAPFNASDRLYFRSVMATGRFSSGEFSIGRVRGKPTILFGYPLKDGSGRITDVAVVSLSSDRYERFFQSKELATEASLALLDHKGTVIFGRPGSASIGQQDREDLFRKMTAGPDGGSFEGFGLTGIRRIFTYRKLRLPGESQPYMYVRAGISVSSILDRTRKDFLLGMGSIVLAAILVLLFSVFLSKRFVLDKVAALKGTTKQLSRGDLTARVPESVSGGELGELGNALDNMAHRLQEADARRQEAGAEVTRVAQEWQRTFDATNDAIWILDRNQHVMRSNRTAERFFPAAGGRFVGRHCYEIVHGTSEPPPDCPILRSRKSLRRESMDLFLGGSWFEVIVDPLLDEEGRFDGAIHIVSDITGRKKAEAERNRLTAAIEQAGETIVITDLDGEIQYVNPAFERTTGYSRNEVTGKNPRVLNSGKQDEAFYRRMWETISGGRTWEGRLVNKRKDGTLYNEDATISPVLDATGKIVNYVAVKRDVTEHLRLADQFQQSQKMESVGLLAGGVAHDFNNLLTVITGYSELLLQKVGKESPLRREVEEIRSAGERAAALTQQLLAFSRKQIIEPKVLDLNLLTADLGKMLVRLIGENIDLRIVHGKNLGRVKVDPVQFEQVLINLAVNARDAMPDGGTLLIETANVELDEKYCAQRSFEIHPGQFVKLAVNDTGHGMTEETLQRVFEPFFTTKETGKGTGLGLSMIYGAVKQAGGSIEVHSELGIGTTFRIYLPCVEEEVKPPADDRPTVLPGGTETVLAVEDDDTVRELCVRILERLGYKVLTASNGPEANALAQGYGDRIDLLLTDVVMPGMNGSEMATQLILHHPEMKVLFMSGYTDDAISHRGVLDDGVAFIGKPYTPLALARKLREVLDKA